MSNYEDLFLEAMLREREAQTRRALLLREVTGAPFPRLRRWAGRGLARAGVWALRQGNAWARHARRPARA